MTTHRHLSMNSAASVRLHGVRLLLIALLLLQGMPLAAQTGKPDRSTPPTPGPPPSLKLRPVTTLKLSNGLPVLLLEKHDVPLVQMSLVVKAGSVMDPQGKDGLASMTAAMMTEGAGKRNALQLADAVDFLGARLTASAGHHTMSVDLNTPVARLDSALLLMADVVLRPAFPAEELNRKRLERLTTLVQWRDEPRMLASVLFSRTLYGTHPYGRPMIGSEASLRAVTPDDLRAFHANNVGPNNATLIVVGDVTAPVIRKKLEAALGKWRPVKSSTPTLPEITQVAGREVIIVDKPGAPQSEIRIGRIGVARNTEDYFPIMVMNTILGGSFASRLNMNLREAHGYTYGAGSSFDFRLLKGPFLAASAVQTAVTDSALTEFMKELHGILKPVSETELERAKNYLALGFPADFQTIGQIAGQIEQLVIFGLPDTYFNTYIERVLAVTREDVQRVAQKYLDPEKVAVIIVGDRKEIEEKVKTLNLGPIRNMTVEDVLGKAPALGAR